MRPTTRKHLLVVAILLSLLVGTLTIAAGYSPMAIFQQDERSAESDELTTISAGVQQVHATGITGDNVTVAVLDPTGFNPSHPALAGRIVETRAFAAGETIRNNGADTHGTAAATVIARTAPEADLYLTSFDTSEEFRSAVTWLLTRDVDVIVAPVGFYGRRGNGSSLIAKTAARTARQGVVFVAPVGNLGRGHWWGSFTPTDDGRHRFQGGTRNYLLGDSDRVTVWLSWRDTSPNASFSLELYRTNGTASRLVARSQPFRGDDTPNERIVANVDPAGTYYFVVRGPAQKNGTTIEISSPTHAFQYRDRSRSIVAPATAESVIAVGAFDAEQGQVTAFSSAGPISNGRPGVDIIAPSQYNITSQSSEFVGSSAAAAYTAGVIALMFDVNPGLKPVAIEAILQTTARDIARPGPDTIAGHGVVSPPDAVKQARNATQS